MVKGLERWRGFEKKLIEMDQFIKMSDREDERDFRWKVNRDIAR